MQTRRRVTIWNERGVDWRLWGSSSDLNSWLTYSIALPLLSNVAHRLNITIICCLHCRVNAKYHLKRKMWAEVGGGKATGRTYTHPQNPQQSLVTCRGVLRNSIFAAYLYNFHSVPCSALCVRSSTQAFARVFELFPQDVNLSTAAGL
jgi:hypothetical protein